jgi:AcrR family transcriptional regulator
MAGTSRYRDLVRSRDRRTRLLGAAADVFSRRGFEAATIDEITRLAGVAKGSFYREFESKDAIAVALKQVFLDEMTTRGAQIASRLGRDDIWALTDEFLAMIVDMHLEYRDIASVLAREAPAVADEHLGASDERMAEMIAMGIRVGTASGVFSVDDPEMVAHLLMHGVQGLLHQQLLYRPDVDRDRLLAAARHVVRRTLAAQ